MNNSKVDISAKPIKKSLSISWRLAIYVACMGFFLCLSLFLALIPFHYSRNQKQVITEAHILAEAVCAIYERLGYNEPKDFARSILLRVARTPYVSLVNVQDKNGLVNYSTDSRELGRHYDIKYGVLLQTNEIRVTHITSDTNTSIGSVTVVIDKDLMNNEVNRLFAQIAIALLIVIFLLSFLVKGLVEKLVIQRLSNLMNLVENAEQGSFLIRGKIERFDEIGHVILGFNQLLGVITQIEAKHLEKDLALQDAKAQRTIRVELEEVLAELKDSNEKLERKVQAQELLMQAAHRLGGTLNKEAIVERLVMLIQEKLKNIAFVIFLIDQKNKEKQFLYVAAQYGLQDALPAKSKIIFSEGITGMVAKTGSLIRINNLEKETEPKFWETFEKVPLPIITKKFGAFISVPMIHKGKVLGVIDLFNQASKSFDADDEALLSALAALVALTIVNAELYETTLELATSDPLTGIMNRRAMVRQIQYELARSQRFNTQMAILLIDVDFFKAYNDRMGHVLGDAALKGIVEQLQKNLRKVDTLARFGGEEFCVILPQTDLENALDVAKKLCESVRNLKIRGAEKQNFGYLSVSIGIVIVPNDIKNLDNENAINDILNIADKALYEAKSQGRDKFIHLG